MTIRLLSACVLFAMLSLGCGRIERTRQCVRVVTTVNTALDEIAERQDAGVGNAAGEREIAARYEKLAADLAIERLESEPLAKAVAEYRELALDTGKLLRKLADARERNEPIAMPVAIAASKRELQASSRRDKLLAARIDSICQSP